MNTDSVHNSLRGIPVGRILRAAAGVDEELIRVTWADRHRYTGLGGIVVGTAAAAAASLLLAISLMVDEFRWYFVLGPILWGLLVFNLDRWLVASTHGVGRPWKLIPRLAIAVLFGFIIAEPVVLWTFGDSIEEHILDERALQVDTAISRLKACNPEDDHLEAARLREDPACEGIVVDRMIPPGFDFRGADRPSALDDTALANRRETLLTQLSTVEGEVQTLEESNQVSLDRYEREIRGSSAGDTTGREGIGPVARSILDGVDERNADAEAKRNEIATLRSQLDAVDAGLTSLDDERRETAAAIEVELVAARDAHSVLLQEYQTATAAAVSKRIDEYRDRNGTEIGLLQRFDALSSLTGDHSHMRIARWILTLLLIAVDSMPVIAKAIGGKSAYDEIFTEQLNAAKLSYGLHIQNQTEQDIKDLDVASFDAELTRTVHRDEARLRASNDLYQVDDAMMALHKERDLEWERSAITLTDHGLIDTSSRFQPTERSAPYREQSNVKAASFYDQQADGAAPNYEPPESTIEDIPGWLTAADS